MFFFIHYDLVLQQEMENKEKVYFKLGNDETNPDKMAK
jgi:hypothetical protein